MFVKTRIVFIFIFFTLLWGGLIARAIVLQVVPHKKLAKIQARQFNKRVKISSRRGDIVDRHGVELATSSVSYSLYVDPKLITQKNKTAWVLAKSLNLSYTKLLEKIVAHKNRRFLWVKRKLSLEQKNQLLSRISKYNLDGMGFIEESKRYYPQGDIFSQAMGFVGSEEQGLEGIELLFNKPLKGKQKSMAMQRDARGRVLLKDGNIFASHPDGSNIHLTIDSQLQFYVQKELKKALQNHKAVSAIGLVLDVETSEILAMANVPTFDLNHPLGVMPELRKNRAITDAFEPGSTIKTFVVASALNRGIIQPNTLIDCEGGKFKIGKRLIREADAHHSFDQLSVAQILAFSSNVGTSKIALKLGAKSYRDDLISFGFGNKAEIRLPGEGSGIVQPLPWNHHLLANVSFGHGMAATALQILMAYNSIANGGMLMRPILIKEINNPDTGESKQFYPKPINRVLSENQAATMRLLLSAVTMPGGTGTNARIPGFPVAGKTGTAQVVDHQNGGYKSDKYISSFAGFFPVSKPKFVIYVAVNEPEIGYYGSQVAAPIFKKIGEYLIRHNSLSPVIISNQNILDKTLTSKPSVEQRLHVQNGKVPMLKGLGLREVLNIASQKQYNLNIIGTGHVIKTVPAEGMALLPDNKFNVFLE